jgi:UDP-2,4-diacetamido-2,4,6-trideoxy-beta-L-altropyranose hydrolase
MKIAFRVDGSTQIGTGHVARSLTLANALRAAGAQTQIVSRHLSDAMAERIRAGGHALALLPHSQARAAGTAHAAWLGTSQEEDARATSMALPGAVCDWLVVDHYALDAEWEQAVRPRARRILAIDDLADRPHACDVLLDQNLQPAGSSRYDGLLPQHCRTLIGPAYALLRPEFHDAPARDSAGETRRLNIFFGGIDAAGLTLLALHELAPLLAGGMAADVVAGRDNRQLPEIRACCAELGAALHVQSGEMARLFAAADLGVGAGGATSWERCRMGLPTVVVSVADNQRSGCQALRDHGAAVWLGDASALSPGAIAAAVERLAGDAAARLAMARQGQALVDGRGTERVMMHMMRDRVVLRAAAESDAHRAWLWRNHPHTRYFSGESAELAWDRHREWWHATLASADRELLMASCGGIDFGVLRFDYDGDAAAVSIYLDPGLGGLGLGSAALRAGNDWVRRHGGIHTLAARILQMNRQSQRSFAAAGYRQAGEERWTRLVNGQGAETDL